MDIKSFVKNIQEILIKTFFDLGINTSILDDNVGVFVKNKFAKYDKIAAIGLRVKKGVVYHGISINIKNDLSFYDNIIACGLLDHGQTSVFDILGKSDVLEFDNILSNMQKHFGIENNLILDVRHAANDILLFGNTAIFLQKYRSSYIDNITCKCVLQGFLHGKRF